MCLNCFPSSHFSYLTVSDQQFISYGRVLGGNMFTNVGAEQYTDTRDEAAGVHQAVTLCEV